VRNPNQPVDYPKSNSEPSPPRIIPSGPWASALVSMAIAFTVALVFLFVGDWLVTRHIEKAQPAPKVYIEPMELSA